MLLKADYNAGVENLSSNRRRGLFVMHAPRRDVGAAKADAIDWNFAMTPADPLQLPLRSQLRLSHDAPDIEHEHQEVVGGHRHKAGQSNGFPATLPDLAIRLMQATMPHRLVCTCS